MKRTFAVVVALVLALSLVGCGKKVFLMLEPQPHKTPKLVKTKGLNHSQYKTLIVLRPELLRSMEKTSTEIISSQKSEYVSHIEKLLIGQGFTLVSDDVLIREKERIWSKVLEAYKGYRDKSGTGGADIAIPKYTPAETAILLGKSTGSDAIVKINRLEVGKSDLYVLKVQDKFYEMADKAELNEEVAKLEKKKKRKGDDFCVLSFDNLEFTLDMEILDVDTGTILAKGDSVLTTRNILPETYRAQYEAAGCESSGETNYSYSKYTSLRVFDAQIYQLLDMMFSQLSS